MGGVISQEAKNKQFTQKCCIWCFYNAPRQVFMDTTKLCLPKSFIESQPYGAPFIRLEYPTILFDFEKGACQNINCKLANVIHAYASEKFSYSAAESDICQMLETEWRKSPDGIKMIETVEDMCEQFHNKIYTERTIMIQNDMHAIDEMDNQVNAAQQTDANNNN